MTRVRVGGTAEMSKLSRSLREVGRSRTMQRRARERIQDAARPTVGDLRSAVRAVDPTSSKGGHARPDSSTQLRARIAAATGVKVTFRGVRFLVDAQRVGDHGRSLPKYMDAELPRYHRWLHPVFQRPGRPVVIEEMRGQPWFFATLRRSEPRFHRAVDRAITDVIREVTRG